MKKRIKKLTLHRETLRSLAQGQLEKVAGASYQCSIHTYCVTDCPYCPTETFTAWTACEWTCGC